MAHVEAPHADELNELLRKHPDAEQSTISDCAHTLIERVVTGLHEDPTDHDEEELRAGFAGFARHYPLIRHQLFDGDPDLRLDMPFEPDADISSTPNTARPSSALSATRAQARQARPNRWVS